METTPLTGRAAAEALGAYMRIANAGASFDSGRVARAVRCQARRRRLTGALAALRHQRSYPTVRPTPRRSCRHQASRRVVSARSSGPPGRPRPRPRGWIYVGAPGSPAFENGWGNA